MLMIQNRLKTAYDYISTNELLMKSIPSKSTINLPLYINFLYNHYYDKKSFK